MIVEDGGGGRSVFGRFLVVFLDSFLALLLVALYVYLNVTGAEKRMRLRDLERAKRELEKRKAELRVNIEYLTSPEQLELAARRRLGMEPLTGDRIVVLRPVAATQARGAASD